MYLIGYDKAQNSLDQLLRIPKQNQRDLWLIQRFSIKQWKWILNRFGFTLFLSDCLRKPAPQPLPAKYKTKINPKLVTRNLPALQPGLSALALSSPWLIDPLTPINDQDRISPHNIITISSRQVMRIKKISIRDY